MTMQNYRNLPGGAVTRARQLRRNRTEAEDRLWYALRDRLPQHKWRFQVPFQPYYADFACLKAMLIVEVDGGQHDQARARDAARTRHLTAQGYRVLRFWNHDVLANTDGVVEVIAEALSPSLSLSPREREGAAKRRKGEGEAAPTPTPSPSPSPSPSHAAAQRGPHPLPSGEGK